MVRAAGGGRLVCELKPCACWAWAWAWCEGDSAAELATGLPRAGGRPQISAAAKVLCARPWCGPAREFRGGASGVGVLANGGGSGGSCR